MRQNPYQFPPVPSHEQIMEENALKPHALLKRIKKLEKEIKLLKSQLPRSK